MADNRRKFNNSTEISSNRTILICNIRGTFDLKNDSSMRKLVSVYCNGFNPFIVILFREPWRSMHS